MTGSWILFANEFGDWFAEAIWRASLQGAIGISLVSLVCRIWRHIPSDVRCALWLLICIKFIVALAPTGIAVPCLPKTAQAKSAFVDPAIAPTLTYALPQTGFSPPPQAQLSANAWISAIWMMGVVAVGATTLAHFLKLRRQIRRSQPCEDQGLLKQAHEACQKLGLRAKPRLLITNQGASAMAFGGRLPSVLLSVSTLAHCSVDERMMILAHEFAHIRRGDTWWGLAPQVAQTLFYFHPLAWLACREYSFAREAACDDEVISCLNITAESYGRLLLKIGVPGQVTPPLCLPGVSSHFRQLRRRIAMLDKPTKSTPRQTRKRALAVSCLVGALCIVPFSFVHGQYAATVSTRTVTKPTAKSPLKKAIGVSNKHSAAVASNRAASSTRASLHVFRLQHADADKTVELLHKVLSAQSGGKMAADAKSNTIVVNADDTTTVQIAGIIKNLDVSDRVETKSELVPKEPQKVTVYSVKYTEIGNLTSLLHTLYGNPSIAVVKVAADFRTNSIVVTAPENRTQEVSALIEKLDVPESTIPENKRTITRMIRVRYGDPKQIIRMVVAMMKNSAPQFIAQDLTSNDIIVVTTQENTNRVQTLVNILDVPKPN